MFVLSLNLLDQINAKVAFTKLGVVTSKYMGMGKQLYANFMAETMKAALSPTLSREMSLCRCLNKKLKYYIYNNER